MEERYDILWLIKYIDIAIDISKNAKYHYGAIVVKDNKLIGRSDDKTLMETSMYSCRIRSNRKCITK